MVARGRGKKAPAAAAAAAASATASEVVEPVANGDVAQEGEAARSSVVASPLAKKGRVRNTKKQAREEIDESPPLEIVEKPTKAAKPAKGSKKATKGKAAVEVEEVPSVNEEKKQEELIEEAEAPPAESKPAAAEKKSHRKRKADEKVEEPTAVAKKAPKTKTKAAKKETVDSAGVPEDPAVAAEPVAEPQTNGNKKSSTSRKRGAQKIEEPKPETPIKEDVDETETAPPPAKKSSKSKASKKEPKKPAAPKSKGSKKAVKEEDAPEDDILPEDEFVPEVEEEEEEQPKAKKIVKSKGSRKQLKEDIPPAEEEITSVKDEQPQSEAESPIEDEKKSKGKKPAAKKAPAKKESAKKASKGKKGAKDEAEDQDADIEISEGKANGNAKPKTEPEKKPARGRKRGAATPIDEADETDGSKSAKPETFLNATVTEYIDSDFSIDKKFKLKISSWNIAGLRSWLKKDGLQYLKYEQPDILCLQEIKCTPDQLPEEARIPGYHPYWLCKPGGHAGVAVYSKIMPIHVEYGIDNAEQDEAGRMITAEYEKFYLICAYVPNSGRKLVNLEKRMQWEELFREYVQRLDKIKPVIIAGDMNVSHKEIDLANPKTNTKNAGFTPEERDAMTKLFELGYVDTFRQLYPDQKGAYTFWSYMGKARSKNVGWRLDYFIVSERFTSKVVESTIRAQVLGSDHCPITLFLNI